MRDVLLVDPNRLVRLVKEFVGLKAASPQPAHSSPPPEAAGRNEREVVGIACSSPDYSLMGRAHGGLFKTTLLQSAIAFLRLVNSLV